MSVVAHTDAAPHGASSEAPDPGSRAGGVSESWRTRLTDLSFWAERA